MVIKGSDRSHDFKTRERKAPDVRSAPRAAARKAIRDKLEKQARDTAHNDYVNQPQEQNAPEAYGTGSYAYIQNMADIVAVFAVKAGLNDTEPLDVLTMDARRIRIFREVFWDMVTVSSKLTETEVDSGLTDETTCRYWRLTGGWISESTPKAGESYTQASTPISKR